MRDDVHRARALRDRAWRLYLRAVSYALRALAHAYPGFAEQLSSQPHVAVQRIGMEAPKQDRTAFMALLHKALAVDLDADPEHRLMNMIAQRRARWLLERIDELFL